MIIQSVLILHKKENSKVKIIEFNANSVFDAVKSYVSRNILNSDFIVEDDILNDILLEHNIWLEKEGEKVYHLNNGQSDLYFSEDLMEIQKIHKEKGNQHKLGFGVEAIY